jgi:hypothetical protein
MHDVAFRFEILGGDMMSSSSLLLSFSSSPLLNDPEVLCLMSRFAVRLPDLGANPVSSVTGEAGK